jgi:iron complex transport system permease protein
MKSRAAIYPIVLTILALAAVFWISLRVGSVANLDLDSTILLRLPRAVLAVAVGAGLVIAGAVLQVIFSNPLCEPYTLGISSGAALGAVIGMTLGMPESFAGLALPGFLGAVLFAAVLLVAARSASLSIATLLLVGVMLGLLGSSLVALWMALSDPQGVSAAIGWLLGDLSRARLHGALFCLGSVTVLSFSIWTRHRELDALLGGPEVAAASGVNVAALHRRMIFLVSVLVGICVSAAGSIGFIGVMVPHLVRRWTGSFHRSLLPVSALVGATVLLLGDIAARVIADPVELPVGVITALIGAPLFVWVMFKWR